MNVIPDTIDLSDYLKQPDAAVKVRPAASFVDELRAEFAPRASVAKRPEMFSTKLRQVIEFRPGEVTAWAGYNGHRKSMFTGQVALDMTVQSQRTMMASFEMQPARTLARMVRQAYAKQQPNERELCEFADWTDNRLWMFDHIGRISPEQCIAVCRYFAQNCGGQQVFIDSMMMVCASEEHLDEQKQFTTDIVRLAQETGLHIHLVCHCRKPQQGEEKPPTKYDLRGSAAISDQAHNVITVWANKAKKAKEDDPLSNETGEPDALVTIEKQRNGRWEGRVRLWFDDASLRFCDDRISAVEPYAMGVA